MRHSFHAGLLALALSASAAAAVEPDLRCTRADQTLTQQLRDLVNRDDAAPTMRRAMAQTTMARIDCKHGRSERGLRTYRDAAAALAAPDTRTVAAR